MSSRSPLSVVTSDGKRMEIDSVTVLMSPLLRRLSEESSVFGKTDVVTLPIPTAYMDTFRLWNQGYDFSNRVGLIEILDYLMLNTSRDIEIDRLLEDKVHITTDDAEFFLGLNPRLDTIIKLVESYPSLTKFFDRRSDYYHFCIFNDYAPNMAQFSDGKLLFNLYMSQEYEFHNGWIDVRLDRENRSFRIKPVRPETDVLEVSIIEFRRECEEDELPFEIFKQDVTVFGTEGANTRFLTCYEKIVILADPSKIRQINHTLNL